MTGKIYKITNDINNKVYIGKTINSLEERFSEHCQDRRKRKNEKRPLYDAMNKYGTDCFHIELVEECDTSILSEREQYWIGYYDGYTKGYNATKGGDGTPIYDYKEIEQLLKEGCCSKEICNKIGCCVDTVRKVAKNCNISIPLNPDSLMKKMIDSKIRIYQYDKDMNYIQSFDSYVNAAHWLVDNGYAKTYNGGVRGHVSEAVRKKRKSAYTFYWFDKMQ